jgi:hypothetical protein
MTPSKSPPTDAKPAGGSINRALREAMAVLMILTGSLVLVGLVFISNDRSPVSQELLFGLGLPGMGLVSAFAQLLVFGGVAILWAILRHRR